MTAIFEHAPNKTIPVEMLREALSARNNTAQIRDGLVVTLVQGDEQALRKAAAVLSDHGYVALQLADKQLVLRANKSASATPYNLIDPVLIKDGMRERVGVTKRTIVQLGHPDPVSHQIVEQIMEAAGFRVA